MANESNTPQHPALQGFNPTVESTKHVLGSTLKTALKGALVGGLVVAGLMAVPFVLGSVVTAGYGSVFLGKMTLGMAANVALAGAAVGGAIGLVSGVSGAEAAAEDAANERIMAYDRSKRLEQREQMLSENAERLMASRQQLAQTMGAGQQLSPQTQLPYGGMSAGQARGA